MLYTLCHTFSACPKVCIFVKKSLVQSDLKHGITDLKMCFASGKFHCPFCLSNLNLIVPGDTVEAVPPQF